MKDLYSYVNGPWTATHVIPDDRAVDGTFHRLRDDAEKAVHDIITDDDGRPGALFASFMDTDGIKKAGWEPLASDIARITSATDAASFARLSGELSREGMPAALVYYVTKDSEGHDQVLPYLLQYGLGLPDEAYYRSEEHAETRAAYRDHVARMLGFLEQEGLLPEGISAEEAAERILELETEIAAGHWDVVASRDAVATYNPVESSSLPSVIQELLAGSGLREGRVVSMMPSYVEHLAGLLVDERLDEWKLWAIWQLLNSTAAYLDPAVSEANFDFFGRTLSGATVQRDRWKRGVGLAEGLVGDDLGKAYVKRHFPASSKEQMLELVGFLEDAYRERITDLPWMTEETKKRALEKLDLFQAKIGYPDHWRDYGDLAFSDKGEDLVANVRLGNRHEHDHELSKIDKPVDRAEWFATPQTVNAFYNPTVNDITFPAAILRPPFFDPEADAAEKFGAIGAVIGHEIGHGFDDQGSQYDGYGNLRSWWTDEDRAAFEKLTANLVEQFNGLVPSVLKGQDVAGVNGEFTLGENIGDLGGLGIALVAYRRYLDAQGHSFADTASLPFDIEGADEDMSGRTFNGLQRFFLAWARVWRTAIRPEMAKQYLAIDPHSPAEFRCNVIASNIDEFYDAFPETEDMFVEPERRVAIW